ncbi:TPA: hypothetical protein ACPY4Y_000112 [Yersinia enterocolitica]|nr:hypothetical protein [Yersinia enterocolitica]
MSLRNLFIATPLTLLTGCSHLLPLDYQGYNNADAATIYIQNDKGNVGTTYIAKYHYVKADACYQMDTRYELNSNILAADGNIIESKIEPGGFYAVEQSLSQGPRVAYLSASFVPEPGKHYFISPGYGSAEIPDNLKITLSMDKDEIFQQYGKDRVKGWPVRNYCKNFVQKALSFN